MEDLAWCLIFAFLFFTVTCHVEEKDNEQA